MEELVDRFQEKFNITPTIACAPGRVNIIGEHVDYSGYSVLPCALQQNVCAVAALKSGRGRMFALTTLGEVENDATVVEIDSRIEELLKFDCNRVWTDYLLCGVYARRLLNGSEEFRFPANQDLYIMIHGEVPPAAGLSSSSALVVATAMAIEHLLPIAHTRIDFIKSCIDAERLIGTCGGGMDQSASCLGEEGMIMHIHFQPRLAVEHIHFPDRLALVVCNSFTDAEKSGNVRFEFNKRFAECRLGALLLARELGVSMEHLVNIKKLYDLEQFVRVDSYSSHIEHLEVLDALRSIANRSIHQHDYRIDELRSLLLEDSQSTGEVDSADLLWSKYFNDRPAAREVFLHAGNHPDEIRFSIFNRVKHVIDESIRVIHFRLDCEELSKESNWESDDVQSKSRRLGELMDASHESLKTLYECSCPQLDTLVDTCRRLGALGSRLTGAGWGGCVVSLIRAEQQDSFLQELKESDYYKGISEDLVDKYTFVTFPGPGAHLESWL